GGVDAGRQAAVHAHAHHLAEPAAVPGQQLPAGGGVAPAGLLNQVVRVRRPGGRHRWSLGKPVLVRVSIPDPAKRRRADAPFFRTRENGRRKAWTRAYLQREAAASFFPTSSA